MSANLLQRVNAAICRWFQPEVRVNAIESSSIPTAGFSAETAWAEARLARNEIISHATRVEGILRTLEISLIEAGQREAERVVRERLRAARRALRVLFLVPHTSLFDVFLPIYRKMEADPRFEPEVLAFRRADIDASETEEEARIFFAERQIRAHVVGFCADGFLPDLNEDHYDLLFYTLGSVAYPPKYQIETTSRRFLTCYIAYGFLQANQIEYQFNQSFHHAAWRVFAATEREEALYAHYCPRTRANVFRSGYPKFDLYASRDFEMQPERPLVIWAPHWTIGLIYPQLNLGMFDRICMEMLEIFDAFQEIDFIYKPHPNLPYALEKTTFMNPAGYRIYRDMLEARPNVRVWNHGDNIHLFQTSSGMVTDSVSFLAEYLPSGQPLLFLNRPDRVPFAEVGESIVALHYQGQDAQAIRAFLSDVVRGKSDHRRAERLARYPTLLGISETPASAAIIEHLADDLIDWREGARGGGAIAEEIARHAAGKARRREAVNAVSSAYWLSQSSYNYATLFEERHREQIRFTNEHFLPRLGPESVVIDLGCADGWHSSHVARHCGYLTGYDLNPRFVALAVENAAREGLSNCRFATGNVLTLDFDPASADAVIASGLLTCFARDDEAAAVLALGSRALPIGGLLLLKDTLHRGAGDKLHMTGGYAGCYRVLDSYHQLIREAGFRLIADRWIDVSGETGSYMAMAEKVDS